MTPHSADRYIDVAALRAATVRLGRYLRADDPRESAQVLLARALRDGARVAVLVTALRTRDEAHLAHLRLRCAALALDLDRAIAAQAIAEGRSASVLCLEAMLSAELHIDAHDFEGVSHSALLDHCLDRTEAAAAAVEDPTSCALTLLADAWAAALALVDLALRDERERATYDAFVNSGGPDPADTGTAL